MQRYANAPLCARCAGGGNSFGAALVSLFLASRPEGGARAVGRRVAIRRQASSATSGESHLLHASPFGTPAVRVSGPPCRIHASLCRHARTRQQSTIYTLA
ncbi:hypothetical protein MRX96_029253 [Rhipicephalus microplus]